MAIGINRAVRQSLTADSRRRAKDAATDIRACLEPSPRGADPRGAYDTLKRWYWHACARAPNPSQEYTEKVRGELQTLYQREEPHPPDLPLITHVDPAKLNNNIPSEVEAEAAVPRLLPHRAGGQNQLCKEQFKQWQREAYPGEQSKTPLWKEQ